MTRAEKVKRWRNARAARMAAVLSRHQLFVEMAFGVIWTELTGQPLTPQCSLGMQHRRNWMDDDSAIPDLRNNAVRLRRERNESKVMTAAGGSN